MAHDEHTTTTGSVDKASDIGVVVRTHRTRRGLNQTELAELAGVGRRFVIDLECGKETVQTDCLFKVCHALELDIMLRAPLPPEVIKQQRMINMRYP